MSDRPKKEKKYRNDSIPTFFKILIDIADNINMYQTIDQKLAAKRLIKTAVEEFKDCWEWMKKNNLLEE